MNWVKEPLVPPDEFELDYSRVDGITSSLKPAMGTSWAPRPLSQNARRCFQGPIPVGEGFILSYDDAQGMLDDRTVSYAAVVRPYVVGEDIAVSPNQRPSRMIIDFDNRALEAAAKFPRALKVVRDEVKPQRDKNSDKGFREKWWQFGRPRGEMRAALSGLPTFIASTATGKRLLIARFDNNVLPSNATNVFAFDDDYALGILLSRTHDAWAWAQSSTLKGDLRYTPTTVFATFPWPDPVDAATRERVAAAASALYARRSELCIEHDLGLTKLYNLMDEGAFSDLAKLHRDLDVAVAAAYGWSASVAQNPKDLVERLADLNRQIATGERDYHPFPDPDELGRATTP